MSRVSRGIAVTLLTLVSSCATGQYDTSRVDLSKVPQYNQEQADKQYEAIVSIEQRHQELGGGVAQAMMFGLIDFNDDEDRAYIREMDAALFWLSAAKIHMFYNEDTASSEALAKADSAITAALGVAKGALERMENDKTVPAPAGVGL